MNNAQFSLKRNFASIFSKAGEYAETKALSEEEERNLDLILYGNVEDISVDDFCYFLEHIQEYADVVHLCDPFMDSIEERLEKATGIKKKIRVL